MINNIEIKDRHFYHCFPRVRKEVSKDKNIKNGIEILKSIKKIGLILTPEITKWEMPTINDELRVIYIKQIRISFTELSSIELEKHSKKFGNFAIEYDIETLRKLGALPVIYMPQFLEGGLSSLGSMIVTEIKDIKYTINQLHQLFQLSSPENIKRKFPSTSNESEDVKIILTNSDETGNIEKKYNIPSKNLQDILNFIGYKNAPFDLMEEVLNFIQNLICKTDDDMHDILLEYYRQREWRLFPIFAIKDNWRTRELTNVEKTNILDIDKEFWGKRFTFEKESFRIIDESLVMDTFEGKHISELISSVIVPKEALHEAKEIFGEKAKSLD